MSKPIEEISSPIQTVRNVNGKIEVVNPQQMDPDQALAARKAALENSERKVVEETGMERVSGSIKGKSLNQKSQTLFEKPLEKISDAHSVTSVDSQEIDNMSAALSEVKSGGFMSKLKGLVSSMSGKGKEVVKAPSQVATNEVQEWGKGGGRE